MEWGKGAMWSGCLCLKLNTCARVCFIKSETLVQVFSCEFCEISQNTFYYWTLLVAASETSIIESFKLSQDGKIQTAVEKSVNLPYRDWSILALTRLVHTCPIETGPYLPYRDWSMLTLSRLVHTYPIETGPYLPYRDWSILDWSRYLTKIKFINKKDIKFLKENWYIGFTLLGESVVVQINIILRLFVQLPIYFPVLLCYSSVDMRVNLRASFVLILSCLVSDRR